MISKSAQLISFVFYS